MNQEQQILTILYEMAMSIGGEVSVKPLLTKTLQRLLYHTSFPAGAVFVNMSPDTGGPEVEAILEAAIGDFDLGATIGNVLALPAALLRGGFELHEDPALLGPLSGRTNTYTAFLRLPIDRDSVILLLATRIPHTELPLTRIFQPVMANLAKAILLCRHHDAYTAGLVAERDTAWENLRKVNRALKTLSAGNEVLVRATEESALLREMCRVAVEVGGYRAAWVGYAQQDDQKTVRMLAQYGLEAGYLEKLRYSWADDEFGRGPTGTAIRSGRLQVVADAYSDPSFAPWRAAAIETGTASILALPLMDSEGHAFGALTIDTAEADSFHGEEIRLLRELASDLSYGIASLRNRAERAQSAERLYRALEDTIQALSATVEMRDPYTSGHQRRVSALAAAIAVELGLDSDCVHGIRLAGMVHDVGKIGVPAEILSKPSRLTTIEMQIVREHPDMGYNILKDVKFSWPVAEIARQHHERLDGSGYPLGLKGDSICFEARIVAVADVVESMASHRPYRSAQGMLAAVEEIEAHRGTHYDARAVDACRKVLEAGFSLA